MSKTPRLFVLTVLTVVLALSACQAPAGQPARAWKLKSIHAPTTDCGHYPRAKPATQASVDAQIELHLQQ